MGSYGPYKVIGITSSKRIVETTRNGAPTESFMCEWGKGRRAEFVIRYFPSRKGWRILDLRTASSWQMPGVRRPAWRGQKRDPKFYPTEDAAVMVALHRLG